MTRWVVIPGGGAVAGPCYAPRQDWRQDAGALVVIGAVTGGLLLALVALLGISWAGDHLATSSHLLARVVQATARVLKGG